MRGFLTLCAVLALAAVALGQNFKGTNVTTKGTGSLSLKSDTYELTEATMVLQSNGDAHLTLKGKQTWKLSGRWTGASSTQASVYLNQGLPRLNVTGYVYLRNGTTATGFTLSGTCEYGRVTANFKDLAASGGGGGSSQLTETFRGRGTFTIRRDQTSLNSCTVKFQSNNRFELSAKSDVANVNFAGTYTIDRTGNYQLNLAGGATGYTGQGEVTMGRDRVEKVWLRGRRSRDTWELRFDRR